MGRFSRRTDHLRRDGTDEPLCKSHKSIYYSKGFTAHAAGPHTCAKCQALHYAALIAERFPNAALVKRENVRDTDRGWKEYRGSYELRVDGELRAYVCSENGWGAGYTVHRATNNYLEGPTHGRIEIERADIEVVSKPADQSATSRDQFTKNFGSKEHAAFCVLSHDLDRFKAPLDPDAYRKQEAASQAARERAEIKRKRELKQHHDERVAECQSRAATYREHAEALRGLNVENEATADAVRFAISLVEQEIETAERGAAHSAKDADEWLAKRFSKRSAALYQALHQEEEGRPIETLYDAANAVTAYARGVNYQDQRVALEREAGRLIDLAA